MKFATAFRQTLFHFKLKGTEVAQASGVAPAKISSFRQGNNIRIDTVERILAGLPTEAKLYLLDLVAHQPDPPEPEPPALVGDYEADHQEGSEG